MYERFSHVVVLQLHNNCKASLTTRGDHEYNEPLCSLLFCYCKYYMFRMAKKIEKGHLILGCTHSFIAIPITQ